MRHNRRSPVETHLHTGNAENNDKARHRGVIMSESNEDDEKDEDEKVNLRNEMIKFCFVWCSGLFGAVVL